jgi:hypothetical protein
MGTLRRTEDRSATGNGETAGGYFRRTFKENENPKLLKKGTNGELYERWLKDHPGGKEVPKNVKAILQNIKSVLRNKRRRRRAEKVQASPVAVAAVPTPAARSSPRTAGRGLDQLEERIEDCLGLARGMDREGLAQVIGLLRSARSGVVRQAGG